MKKKTVFINRDEKKNSNNNINNNTPTIEKTEVVIQHPIQISLQRLRIPETINNHSIQLEETDVMFDFSKQIYKKEENMVDFSNFSYNDQLTIQSSFG
jgi:hypothetical protein